MTQVMDRVTEIEELMASLKELDRSSNESWLESLPDRKKDKIAHADQRRDTDAVESLSREEYQKKKGNMKYYSISGAWREYICDWLAENGSGKVVLDFACGTGGLSRDAAKAGAKLVIGIDISGYSIEQCRIKAEEQGLSENTFFLQGDCENTGLPDNSVDCIICAGMLHHLDLSYAFPEMRRILKPGGKVIASEALNYNPIITLYRRRTPEMRTAWEAEHILSLKDLEFASHFFDVRNVRYWNLFTIPVAYLRNTPIFKPALAVARAIDKVALKTPLVRLMAWVFTFELVKKAES